MASFFVMMPSVIVEHTACLLDLSVREASLVHPGVLERQMRGALRLFPNNAA